MEHGPGRHQACHPRLHRTSLIHQARGPLVQYLPGKSTIGYQLKWLLRQRGAIEPLYVSIPHEMKSCPNTSWTHPGSITEVQTCVFDRQATQHPQGMYDYTSHYERPADTTCAASNTRAASPPLRLTIQYICRIWARFKAKLGKCTEL